MTLRMHSAKSIELDFEVDFAADKMRAWFEDRYEWHPVYPFYDQKSGHYERPTNCVHAPGVEPKADGVRTIG